MIFSKKISYIVLLFVMLLSSISSDVFGQTADDLNRARQQSEQIQRERQLREQDDRNKILEKNRHTSIEVPKPKTPQGQGEGCRQIDKIIFLGASHMSADEETDLTAPYEKTCMNVEAIQNILSDITLFYIEKGYITTRAYLPAQDLTKGTLTINIVPGKVSAIEASDATKLGSLNNIFPGVVGNDLNLRDFEQGIDQLNRLASNNVSLDFKPGNVAGDSIIVLNNRPAKFWHANVAIDNYGSKTTGRNQIAASVSLDNLTGFHDLISLTQKYTLPLNDPSKQSKSTSFLFSVPYGYSTFTTGVNFSDYDSRLITPAASVFHLSGDNRTIYATLDHVLYRDQTDKLSVHATLTHDDVASYIDGAELTVSSRVLTFMELGIDYKTVLFGGNAHFGADFTRGLNWFNALQDPSGLAGSFPHAQFNKISIDAGYTRSFTAMDKNLSFSTQFRGQYAPHVLYGSQQFSVGGIYSVRGYYEESLANDIGFSLRNDVTLYDHLKIAERDIGFQPFVAFDVGAVGSRHSGSANGFIGGIATGFTAQRGHVSFNFYMGHPLFHPDSVDNEGFNSFAKTTVNF